jgi:CheY-like chemotaxis protein
VSTDITKSKLQELEIIKARNQAEQSAVAKEQFLTNMSHEIRTPMNGIIGFARILEDTKLDKSQKQSVEAIKRAGENLMVIINDVLDFSKIEADKMTFEGVNFSLSKTANSVIELFGPKAKDQKIKLFCEIDPEVNDLLVGDPTRLSQILINLVGNALKFTVKGFVELLITQINETDLDTTVQFSIIDTGIGIPKNKIDSIFESFNQASNETTRIYGGTGLGLTITKKLIELQGGSISVKSEVSKGSEFSFSIQYKKGKKENALVKEKRVKQLTSDFLKEIKILLVEDNDLNQLLTTKIFDKWGKTIDIADNGKIAIEKIEKTHYDIILMDIQMPEMDGYDMTRYVRANMGDKSNIPIIALTAHATLGEEQKCLEMGMNDYLSKPFDPNKLLEKLYQNITKMHITESSSTLEKGIETDNLINLEYLTDFAEGDMTFVKEMMALFLKNTPVTLASILESNKSNDAKKLKAEVHKLKSSLGLFGIVKASESVTIIENEIETIGSTVVWKSEVENLNRICEAAIVELQSIVSDTKNKRLHR